MPDNTNYQIAIAGALAAFTVDLLTYPLDTLKTRIQAARGRPGKVHLRGLYSGVGSIIAGTLPSAAVFFVTYEQSKRLLAQHTALPPALAHLTACSLAEMVSCVIKTPIEIVKQRAQVQGGRAVAKGKISPAGGGGGNTMEVLKSLRQSGLKGFGSAYLATVGRNLPFTAIQFPIYENLRVKFEHRWGLQSPAASSLAGSIAGSIASIATTPVDVVKTHVMLGRFPADAGILGVTKEVLRSEGVKGLFRGGLLRTLLSAAGAGIYLGCFEYGMNWFRRETKSKMS